MNKIQTTNIGNISSITLAVGLPAPCPALLSIRTKSGNFFLLAYSWRRAMYLKCVPERRGRRDRPVVASMADKQSFFYVVIKAIRIQYLNISSYRRCAIIAGPCPAMVNCETEHIHYATWGSATLNKSGLVGNCANQQPPSIRPE